MHVRPHRVLINGEVSVCHSTGRAPDALIVLADPTGWWVPHRVTLDGGLLNPLTSVEVEMGGPLWKLGLRWTVPLGGGSMWC